MDVILKKRLDKDVFNTIVNQNSNVSMVLGPEESDCYWELDLEGVIGKKLMVRNPNHGIEPEAYFIKENVIGVGVDSKFYLIYTNNQIKEIDLPFLFHTIAWVDQETIIIRYEIGFIGVSIDNGHVIWEQNTELLNYYEVKNGKIYYETLEGEKGEIDVPFLAKKVD